MKIFIGMLSSHPGLMEQNVLPYAKALIAMGHQVHCLIYKDCVYKQELKDMGTTLHILRERSRYNPINSMRILWFLRKNQADAILLHGNRIMSLVFNPFARWFYQWKGKTIGIAHNFQCRYLNKLDALITTNSSYLHHLYRVIKTPVFTLPPTIILPKTPVAAKPHQPLAIGLWDNDKKNIVVFLQALEKLKTQKVPFRAVVASKFSASQFQSSVKNVKFIPQTSEEDFYTSLDIFCFLSVNDVFGISILKAMAYKKAFVCVKSAGAESILKDISCLPLPRLNPELLSGALQNLLAYPKLTEQQIKTAYNIFNHKYSFQIFKENLNRILKNIIQGV